MTKKEALQELAARRARVDFLAFLRFVWWMPQPLKLGRHTIKICNRLTKAVNDWEQGKSTHLVIQTPFRHGKSDIVSRAFLPWFLGRCADKEPDAIMTGYGADLVESFSKRSRAIVESPQYQLVFPGVTLDKKHNAVADWAIAGSAGTVTECGLGGAITGKGGHLLVVDDYCKNREEAYSDAYREKTWQAFSVDLMSRKNAPATIVIVIATPWHPDDIIGRISQAMRNDPMFPRFEFMVFPASKAGEYPTLFPEMYGPEWYSMQRATLGPTMAAALLDCNPIGIGNRTFRDVWYRSIEKMPNRSDLNVYILIDSANGKRKNNDYTTMFVVGLGRDECYYVLDGIHDRLNLVERTDALFDLVERWQPMCTFWEQVGAMSDVQHVNSVMDERGWHFPITAMAQSVAKDDRIGWLVPIFESGKLWFPNRLLRRASDGHLYDFCQEFYSQEYALFPAVRHDDMLDCLANIKHPVFVQGARFPLSDKLVQNASGAQGKTTGGDWKPW